MVKVSRKASTKGILYLRKGSPRPGDYCGFITYGEHFSCQENVYGVLFVWLIRLKKGLEACGCRESLFFNGCKAVLAKERLKLEHLCQ